MANKTYLLKPSGKMNQGYSLVDESGNEIYNANMIKFKLFGASPFEFTNYTNGVKEEHTIGKTITLEESGPAGFFSTKSSFKYDGEKIWDYLHTKGIRISSSLSSGKIGMTYTISFEGKEIGTIKTSTPKGKSIITTNVFYDVTCDTKDLDLMFLVAFAIAKTDQVLYD